MAFKPIDESKEEFRQYLSRHGVLEALAHALNKIMKDKPENPMEYLHANLAPSIVLKLEHQRAMEKIAKLEAEIKELKLQLQRLQRKK